MTTTILTYPSPFFAIPRRVAADPASIAAEAACPSAQGRASALDRGGPLAPRPRGDRVRAEGSIDTTMILFACFVGLPLILALSVAGGMLTALTRGT